MIRCLCGNAAAAASWGHWAGVDSGGFLGRVQVAGWLAMVCMAKELLHRRTGVLARVHVYFCGESVVH